MLRIGIAGLGGMGTVHARNACVLDAGTLVAVASTRHARALRGGSRAERPQLFLRRVARSRRHRRSRRRGALDRSRPCRDRCATPGQARPAREAGRHDARRPRAARRRGRPATRAGRQSRPITVASTPPSWRRAGSSRAARSASPCSCSRRAVTSGRRSRRTPSRPAASSSTWRHTITTPPAGSSARSPSNLSPNPTAVYPELGRPSATSTTPVVTTASPRGGIAT